MMGGSFLFVWVDDASKCTMSFVATAHFADGPADEIVEAWSDFFHAAMKDHAVKRSGINSWSILDDRNITKLIVTTPARIAEFGSSRRANENNKQPKILIAHLEALKKEGLPFAFFYKLPPRKRSAANGQHAISEAFPEPHGNQLLQSAGWKLMMNANSPLMPHESTLNGINRTQAGTRPRVMAAPRQRNREISAVVGGGVESREELHGRYIKPMYDAVNEDVLLATMCCIMDSSSSGIPATLVLNDDDEVQVVMPDFVGPQEKVSLVPVLVSAIKCICSFAFKEVLPFRF